MAEQLAIGSPQAVHLHRFVEQPLGDPGDHLDVAPVLAPRADQPVDGTSPELVGRR